MSISFKYLRQIAPNQDGKIVIIGAGYVGDIANPDPSTYQLVVGELPPNAVFELPKSKQELISGGRTLLLEMYKQSPIELRDMFSSVITRVNALLDLEDYELALMVAQGVDIEQIQDTELKQQANVLKNQFVYGLQAFLNV